MKVKDVMTKVVHTVGPDTPLKTVATLLVEKRISGVPVCDSDGRVLGVVSERDILVKEQGPAERRPRLLDRLLDGPDDDAEKAAARTAGEAMSGPALTIGPDRAVAAAARLLLEEDVKRLPVVDRDERLVGIVTRTDLMRAFARPDAVIAAEIADDVLRRTLWLEPGDVAVSVVNGEATLEGEIEREADVEVLPRLVAQVAGVVSVDCRVRGRDAGRPAPPAPPSRVP